MAEPLPWRDFTEGNEDNEGRLWLERAWVLDEKEAEVGMGMLDEVR